MCVHAYCICYTVQMGKGAPAVHSIYSRLLGRMDNHEVNGIGAIHNHFVVTFVH